MPGSWSTSGTSPKEGFRGRERVLLFRGQTRDLTDIRPTRDMANPTHATPPATGATITTETLHFENARAALQLLGGDERNLHALEKELGLKAAARDGWIRLEGPADAVGRGVRLFQLLEAAQKDGSPVKSRDFTHALHVVRHDGAEALQALFHQKISTSPKKASITPKTLGQQRYVAAIREHDVTFGIGPAGTGKTYLAVACAVEALQADRATENASETATTADGGSSESP